MYYLSKEELKKACESNRFIVLRAGFDKVAINCRVAFLKHPQRKYAENIDGKTKFNGFYPCDFNEYITLKIPYSGFDEDHEQWDEPEPCPTCGDIDGMVNPCCAGYDPLHYKNCGYG